MKRILAYLFIVLNCIFLINAQPFYRHYEIPVFKNSTAVPYPWIGGLNNAQFANADVNHDGKKDIVVYDNYNKQFFVFLVKNTNSTAYEFAPQYAKHFPDISNWMILKDYNCDGIVDLFTYNGLSNTKVFKGYYHSDTLNFKLQQDGFFYNNGNTNVYTVDVSRPIIEDINQDGDLDFIAFETFGTYLYYYENQRVEKGLSCDSLTFKLVDRCWGNVRDTFSATYSIRDTCLGKFKLAQPEKVLHTGSFMESLDMDNNGKTDLLIGNVGIQYLTALYNSGTIAYGSILKQDARYPSYNTSFQTSSMATPMKLDVDNDGKNDLMVSTFDVGSSNIDNIYWYKNLSADSFKLSLQTKNFMIKDMIDDGENSAPMFFDFNHDGLKDIIIGNGGYKDNINPAKYTLELYKNTGNDTAPAFTLEDADYLNVSTFGVRDLVPNTGDIDNDGDTDLLVGISDGRILWWENTAGSASIPNLIFRGVLNNNVNAEILVQQQAAPFIADIDKDGINDLLIGDKNGRISYYKGSSSTQVSLSLNTSNFGKIRTNTLYNNFGFAQPSIADINHDGKQDLVVGTNNLGLIWYNNIEQYSNPTDSFLPNSYLLENKIIARTTAAIADITNDNKWEIIIGNYNGGLMYYSEKMPILTTGLHTNTIKNLDFTIYPNPANEALTILLPDNNTNYKADIYTVAGQLLQTYSINKTVTAIDISALAKGIYVIRVSNINSSGFAKFIKE